MGKSPPFIGSFIGQRQTSTGQGQARKVGAVASFGVTFGSLSEAGLGSFGATGNLLAGWLGSQLCGRLDRSPSFGDLFGSLLATNSGQLGRSGWVGYRLGC